MSLLMLFNSDSDVNIVGKLVGGDRTHKHQSAATFISATHTHTNQKKPPLRRCADATEQHHMRTLCLTAILELLITCRMYPRIGAREPQRVQHIARLAPLPANTLAVQKLYATLAAVGASGWHLRQCRRPVDLFNQPNLEREIGAQDCGHGTRRFGVDQTAVATVWQRIEERDVGEAVAAVEGRRRSSGGSGGDGSGCAEDVRVRNQRRWLAESGVDLASSVQMMFDIFAQIIDVSISPFRKVCLQFGID